MNRYSPLLSPFKVGDTIIKNRLLYPNANPHFLQGPETWHSDNYMSFMSGLARAGAGMITIAEWELSPGQRSNEKSKDGRALRPTCPEIFGAEAEPGRRVVMIGGSETGVETAMYLAENGHDVTILTRQKELADEALVYASCAVEFYCVVDCNKAGNIQKCMRDAYGKANML